MSGWPGGTKWIHRGDRKLYSRRLITLLICYSAHVHRGALKSQARKSQSCCITVRPSEPPFGYLARLNIFQHFVMRNFFWKDSPLISQFIPCNCNSHLRYYLNTHKHNTYYITGIFLIPIRTIMIHITFSQSRIIKKFFIFSISTYLFRVVLFVKLFKISTHSYSLEFLINKHKISTKCVSKIPSNFKLIVSSVRSFECDFGFTNEHNCEGNGLTSRNSVRRESA